MLSWMSRSGYFPLENIVHVDPYATEASNPRLQTPAIRMPHRVRTPGWQTPDSQVSHPHTLTPPRFGLDRDHFKRLMPEWLGYTAQSDRAGNFCHRESGYLQERDSP